MRVIMLRLACNACEPCQKQPQPMQVLDAFNCAFGSVPWPCLCAGVQSSSCGRTRPQLTKR